MNDGSFKGYHNVAFEPATAPYDCPDIGVATVIKAGGEYCWHLKIEVARKKAYYPLSYYPLYR
jgi:hypothetical protein